MANNPRIAKPVQIVNSTLQDQTFTQIVSSTGETTIVPANATDHVNIIGFVITNASGTAVAVTIKDSTAGTTRTVFALAANGGIVCMYPAGCPLLQKAAVNNNWTATLSNGSVTVNIHVLWQLGFNGI